MRRVVTLDPGETRLGELGQDLLELTKAGLAGIECYYPSHSPTWTAYCLRLAKQWGLTPTGGSDFHGRGEHGADLGAVFVPPETIAALEAKRGSAYHSTRVEGEL